MAKYKALTGSVAKGLNPFQADAVLRTLLEELAMLSRSHSRPKKKIPVLIPTYRYLRCLVLGALGTSSTLQLATSASMLEFSTSSSTFASLFNTH